MKSLLHRLSGQFKYKTLTNALAKCDVTEQGNFIPLVESIYAESDTVRYEDTKLMTHNFSTQVRSSTKSNCAMIPGGGLEELCLRD